MERDFSTTTEDSISYSNQFHDSICSLNISDATIVQGSPLPVNKSIVQDAMRTGTFRNSDIDQSKFSQVLGTV
jgi:hypothetical protein